MNKALLSAELKLRKAHEKAFIHRVNWISLEDRISEVFAEIETLGSANDELGTLYFSCSKNTNPAYAKPWVYRFNSLNQAQISVGWRRLGVWHTIKSEDFSQPKEAMESGAAICFSQDITGKVMVLLCPYTSDLAKVNEDNFILFYGLDPNDLTKRKIRKSIKTFFRYCTATSMISAGNYSDYIFRLWLGLRDIRNRKIQKITIFKLLEKLGIFVLAAAGVWATLLTGNKWPLW
nr:hypothetical protein [uncultured Rhodoferax sp.]